jgi:hypothetical protein
MNKCYLISRSPAEAEAEAQGENLAAQGERRPSAKRQGGQARAGRRRLPAALALVPLP